MRMFASLERNLVLTTSYLLVGGGHHARQRAAPRQILPKASTEYA